MLIKTNINEIFQHTCQRDEGSPEVYLHDSNAYIIVEGMISQIKYCPYCGIEIDTEIRP